MNVVGLDLSLTATGIAAITHPDRAVPQWAANTIETKPAAGYAATNARLGALREEVLAEVRWRNPALVVMEGPALSRNNGRAHDRAGLWWMVYDALTTGGYRLSVVGPNTRAKYATGKGNASKDAVLLAAARRYPSAPISNNNEADAIVLAAIGCRLIGHPIERNLPALHLSALAKGIETAPAPAATPTLR